MQIRNLTIANSSEDSLQCGQALALYADADNLSLQNCRLIGRQDTLFTGPLPLKEMQKGGFRGPKEFAERRINRQHYSDCYICGDVDFIFGSAGLFPPTAPNTLFTLAVPGEITPKPALLIANWVSTFIRITSMTGTSRRHMKQRNLSSVRLDCQILEGRVKK